MRTLSKGEAFGDVIPAQSERRLYAFIRTAPAIPFTEQIRIVGATVIPA